MNRGQLRPTFRILGQRPGLTLDDVLVDGSNQLPNPLKCQRDLEGFEILPHRGDRGIELIFEQHIKVVAAWPTRFRNRTAAITMDHRRRSAYDIAEIVCEVGVVPRQDPLIREVGVLAERHLTHDEVPQRIDTECLGIVLVTGYVANRFRHLGAAHQPPTVRDDPVWRLDSR